MKNDTFIIMLYHGVDGGEEYYKQVDDIKREYIIDREQFISHLDLYKRLGLNVIPLEKYMEKSRMGKSSQKHLVLSFDDGEKSCYTTVAPLLEQYGYRGSFFVVLNWLNQPEYMTIDQIRDLRKRGHGIYSHSMSHSYFSKISDEQIIYELQMSKKTLEGILGEGVNYFSLPTGEYDRRFKGLCGLSGYSNICTSGEGYNATCGKEMPLLLNRFTIRKYTAVREIELILCKKNLTKIFLKFKAIILFIIKNLIGLRRYGRLRTRVLGRIINR